MFYVQESMVNLDTGMRFHDGEIEEVDFPTRLELFRHLMREYGRCVSGVYDDVGGKTTKIGWVFVKRMEYSDFKPFWEKPATYLQETWVTLFDGLPQTTTVQPGYLVIGGAP